MKNYQRILLALDLHPDNDRTTELRAQEIRHDTGAELFVVHALEHITSYGAAFAYPVLTDLEDRLFSEAQKALHARAVELDISKDNAHLAVGAAKAVILEQAKQIDADLIVIGSHTRHAYHLLLGSTADSILHDAPCDVLAVRLND